MPPSSEQKGTTTQEPGAARPAETAASGIGLAQAYSALQSMYGAQQQPEQRALVVDNLIQQNNDQLQKAQAELAIQKQLMEPGPGGNPNVWWRNDIGSNTGVGRVNITKEKIAALESQIEGYKTTASSLSAEKQILPERVAQARQISQLGTTAASRINDFLTGRDIGVSPQEQDLITKGISGISQDVATSRGLNRTDVPVMQAIAPTVANALLSQANANRSMFTGINQFQQGMGLSNQQLQAGLAGQNPAANLTGVYSGLRGNTTETSQSTQQNLGAMDYVKGIGGLASGVGGFMYGLNAGPAPTPKPPCWIAEVLYGPTALETKLLRAWLSTEYVKTWVGACVVWLYCLVGKRIAQYPRLCQVLKPLFDRALVKARTYYGYP